MSQRISSPSFSKDLSIITTILLLLGVGLILWLILQIQSDYNTQSDHVIEQLHTSGRLIEQTLKDDFDYTNYQMDYIAQHMKEKPFTDVEIYQFLKTFEMKPYVNIAVAWNMFSWVDPHQMLTVDATEGIMDKPIDVSKRDYIPSTIREPGKLFFGIPRQGAVSQRWVIPAGMGITDNNGRYIGSIIFGFEVHSLVYKLKRIIPSENISFAVLLNNNIVAESRNSHLMIDNATILSLIKHQPMTVSSDVLSRQTLFDRNTPFSVFQRIDNYPFTVVVTYDRHVSYREFWNLWASRIMELVLIGFFIVLLLAVIRKRIVLPITKLSDIALAISEGKYDVAIPYLGSREADNLAKALNKVKSLIRQEQEYKDKLTTAHHEVQRAKESLEEKVTERTMELEKALQVKTEFLNNVSHEMRTPIHGVMAFSEVLAEDWENFDDHKRRELVGDIHSSSERLLNLLSNILDISKYKAGKMEITPAESDLANIVELILHDCKQLAEQKGLILTHDAPEQPVMGYFDSERIMQVVRNLVINAIKYSDSGAINARITADKTKLHFYLSDEGRGIPKDELEDIFTPFTQSTRTKTGAGGTGLGLSISKEIIEAHHGRIWAEHNKNGVGTVFCFVIPIKQ